MCVYLLRHAPARPYTAAAAGEAAAQLEHLLALLEQYYHPSNTGVC